VDGGAAVIPNITRGGTPGVCCCTSWGRANARSIKIRIWSPAPRRRCGSLETVSWTRVMRCRWRDFWTNPREQFGTRVTVAERDENGRVVGARDAHVWHCSLSLHPDEPALSDRRWGEICDQFVGSMGLLATTLGRNAGGWPSATASRPAGLTTRTSSSRWSRRTAPRRACITTTREHRTPPPEYWSGGLGCGALRRGRAGRGAAACGRVSGWPTRAGTMTTARRVTPRSGDRGRRSSGSSGRARPRARTRANFSARCVSMTCGSVRGMPRAGAPRLLATRSLFPVLPPGRSARSGLAAGGWPGI
jgi:hypothetical protein